MCFLAELFTKQMLNFIKKGVSWKLVIGPPDTWALELSQDTALVLGYISRVQHAIKVCLKEFGEAGDLLDLDQAQDFCYTGDAICMRLQKFP